MTEHLQTADSLEQWLAKWSLWDHQRSLTGVRNLFSSHIQSMNNDGVHEYFGHGFQSLCNKSNDLKEYKMSI